MEQPKKKTFTENMRLWFKGILDPIANLLIRIGLTPTAITLTGVAGNVVGAVLIANGQLLWGGVLALVMGPFDALDGTMARLRGEASNWGAFVDAVSDRYSELILMAGLLYYYTDLGNTLGVMLVYAAAAGSVLVSYTKARADSLKIRCKHRHTDPNGKIHDFGAWFDHGVLLPHDFTCSSRNYRFTRQYHSFPTNLESSQTRPRTSQANETDEKLVVGEKNAP